MEKSITGSCLCGSIVYEADELDKEMAHCHCTMCRKFHGAAFATFGQAKAKHFRWLKGQELLASYAAKNGTTRTFCKVCGSSLLFESSTDKGESVEFALATLDTKIDAKPDAHIFTAYKANWFEITDALPRHNEGRSPKQVS